MLSRILRYLFFLGVVRPIVYWFVGLRIRHPDRLPGQGPAVLVANHNSHLDTMVLMSLFSLQTLPRIKAVAAADYFLKTGLLAWFSLHVVGIIPIKRRPARGPDGHANIDDLLNPISEKLEEGHIIIFFPEGTRGEPEQMGQFKSGIGLLAERHPNVPICPIFLKGLGKAMPRGEAMVVPRFCDVFVGEPMYFGGNQKEFVRTLQQVVANLELSSESEPPPQGIEGDKGPPEG